MRPGVKKQNIQYNPIIFTTVLKFAYLLDGSIVSYVNFVLNPYEVYFYCVLKCVLVQNPEVGNFAGFEVIVKRTKDGRNISKEYIEFLRQRSVHNSKISSM
jgi:hypothetical protein